MKKSNLMCLAVLAALSSATLSDAFAGPSISNKGGGSSTGDRNPQNGGGIALGGGELSPMQPPRDIGSIVDGLIDGPFGLPVLPSYPRITVDYACDQLNGPFVWGGVTCIWYGHATSPPLNVNHNIVPSLCDVPSTPAGLELIRNACRSDAPARCYGHPHVETIRLVGNLFNQPEIILCSSFPTLSNP